MRSHKNCFAALLLATLLSTSCSHFRGHNDDTITTDIKAQMFSEPALKSASVDVSSKDGVVTLSGQVPDDAARLAAYKIATQTKGVTKVNDQMSVATVQAVAPAAVESTPAPTPAPEPPKAAAKPKHAPKREAAQQVAPTPPVTSVDQPAPAAAAAPTASPAAPAPPPPPQPVTVTIPANTVVTVRTIDGIDSKTNQAGQVFKASLDAPIVVDNNVVIPAGGDAYLKLVNASSAGHFTGRSELTLMLTSVIFQGKTYNVSSSDVKQSGSSRGKRTAATVGGGAALGALIGAVAGGGKGAAIGAAVGGGAGTGVQVFTKGQQVKIPSETRLDFTLEQPFDVTYLPGKKSRPRSNSDQPSN